MPPSRRRSSASLALADRAGRPCAAFLRALDYTVFGVLDDYVKGQSLYSLQKPVGKGALPFP
ncbi:MAG: hypothetical protein WDN69_17975 [Aliidongia sp.]